MTAGPPREALLDIRWAEALACTPACMTLEARHAAAALLWYQLLKLWP